MKNKFIFGVLMCLASIFQANAQADTLVVRINPIPAKIILTTSADTVLRGHSARLSSSNCATPSTVQWTRPTAATGNPRNVTPTATTYYTAFCRSGSGCDGPADSIRVAVRIPITPPGVDPRGSVRDSTSFCLGGSLTLNASDALCAGKTITWSNGGTGASITVTPTTAGTYNYTYTCAGTDGIFSANSGAFKLVVNPLPSVPTLSASKLNTVTGESVTLTAAGCTGTVVWSTNQEGTGSIVVNPTQTTTYTAICKSAAYTKLVNGVPTNYTCASPVASITITVNAPKPSVVASSGEACLGESITVTASGCTNNGTYQWSNGATTASLVIGGPNAPYSNNAIFWVICKNVSGDSPRRYVQVKFN